MTAKSITNSELKVRDYSRFGDINVYLGSLKGDAFAAYRMHWQKAMMMRQEYNFPLFLVFETMFKCNLRCVMCIHSSLAKSEYAYREKLPLDKFKEIITEASQYRCPSLTIGGTSEPLLDERVPEMIDFANKAGFLDTMINTNATMLTKEVSRKLIKAGLVRLRIGLDGATAATYEKIRRGADYEKVKQNILGFLEVRKFIGASLPIVRVSCVHLSANEAELKRFVHFWVDKVEYVSIQRYKPHELTAERSRRRMITSGQALAATVRCSQPFERVYIRGNGDVYACCSVVYGPKLGNVFKHSIYQIWNSRKSRNLRAALKRGALKQYPACRKCMKRSFGDA